MCATTYTIRHSATVCVYFKPPEKSSYKQKKNNKGNLSGNICNINFEVMKMSAQLEKHEKLVEKLKSQIKNLGYSQKEFADLYFKKGVTGRDVAGEPSEEDLSKHYDRFKKTLKPLKPLKTRKNATPDKIIGYINFACSLLEESEKNGRYTTADRSAAHCFIVEVKTRVSFNKLPSTDGCEKEALDSIYTLFDSFRKIAKQASFEGVKFVKLFAPFVNEILRPFTSRWHNKITNESKKEFRTDLKQLQKKIKMFLEENEVKAISCNL